MRHMPTILAALGVVSAVSACTHHATFVAAPPRAALGRVVVYRNGIAYYERRAQTLGDKLTLRVPADKIDDFLKSLTVVDARTSQPIPVSFPSRTYATARDIDMTIQLPDKSHRDIILTYVSESPAWKPSYRVVMDAKGKVNLQGWAIVDNTSGEDWQAVRVGVGSSSALAFRFDLHSIRLVHRETLRTDELFAKAPPTGGSLVHDGSAGATLLAELSDKEIPRQAGHPDVVAREKVAVEWSGKRGYPASSDVAGVSARDDHRVEEIARAISGRPANVVIKGFAAPGEPDADARALDRANMLRNQLILKGVPPAQLHVASGGVADKAGVKLMAEQVASRASDKQVDENAPPIGESHFESKSAMTVARGTSAMVSVMQGDAQGETVYLYDAEGQRGNAKFAFKSIRFKNPTTSTLESGPMTVYGEGRFIGEGLTEPIPPGATAVVPFALDRQVVIERQLSDKEQISRLMTLQRGILTCEVQHARITRLKVTNRLHIGTTVLIRHTLRKGWSLVKSPDASDSFGDARLFAVKLGPSETRVVEIEEATPLTRTVDLRSPAGVDLVKVYVELPRGDRRFAEQIRRLLALHAEMINNGEAIVSLRQRIAEYRARTDELHEQIVSLKYVKANGGLMEHLEKKMKEISQRVQNATIAIVDHQEKQMLAKVAFNDGVSELTLEKTKGAADASASGPRG